MSEIKLDRRAGMLVNQIARAFDMAPRGHSPAVAQFYEHAERIALQHLSEAIAALQPSSAEREDLANLHADRVLCDDPCPDGKVDGHECTCAATERLLRTPVAVDDAAQALNAAWELSTWAACINWRARDKDNTGEWLDELREKIESAQKMIKPLIQKFEAALQAGRK